MRENGTEENSQKRDGPQYLEGPSLFLKSENFPPSLFLRVNLT